MVGVSIPIAILHQYPKITENAMTTQTVQRGIQVVLELNQNDVPIVNVFNVDNGGLVSTSDLEDVADVFLTWWNDVYSYDIHSSAAFVAIRVRDISIADGVELNVTTATQGAGRVTGVAAAANAAAVITTNTGRTGRSYRGRTYIGAIPQARLEDAQHLSSAAVTGYLATYIDLINQLEAIGKKLAVLSRIAGGVARLFGVLTEIISIAMDTKVDSQRRRTSN